MMSNLFKLKMGVCILGLGVLTHGAGADAAPVDVRSFDVSGVRLYMSPEEVLSALKTKYNIPVYDSTKSGGRPAPTGDRAEVSHWASRLDNTKQIVGFISVYISGYKTTIMFADRIRGSGSPEVVYSIEMEMDLGQATAANRKQFADSLVAKYGPPTWPGVMQWCGPEMRLAFNGAKECDHNKVLTMTLRWNKLALIDPQYPLLVLSESEKKTGPKPPL